ncbi:MAG: hypothetical protein JWO90_1405 [Solirubrobacterales bacterium]|jgi:hypothetical protein|nr:hypothetical protein [Solirubrobacterales bacterium]
MTHRTAARLHAWLTSSTAHAAERLRSGPERGQGTVEYVALILLVAGVLAVAVAAAGKSSFRLDETVSEQLTKAIETVSK